jgi:hypothetical protein
LRRVRRLWVRGAKNKAQTKVAAMSLEEMAALFVAQVVREVGDDIVAELEEVWKWLQGW